MVERSECFDFLKFSKEKKEVDFLFCFSFL